MGLAGEPVAVRASPQMVLDWADCVADLGPGGDGEVSEAAVLLSLLPKALAAARPAVSAFGVGAAGRGASGRVYLGCNIEFTQTDLTKTIHAEGFVLANALAYGETHPVPARRIPKIQRDTLQQHVGHERERSESHPLSRAGSDTLAMWCLSSDGFSSRDRRRAASWFESSFLVGSARWTWGISARSGAR